MEHTTPHRSTSPGFRRNETVPTLHGLPCDSAERVRRLSRTRGDGSQLFARLITAEQNYITQGRNAFDERPSDLTEMRANAFCRYGGGRNRSLQQLV